MALKISAALRSDLMSFRPYPLIYPTAVHLINTILPYLDEYRGDLFQARWAAWRLLRAGIRNSALRIDLSDIRGKRHIVPVIAGPLYMDSKIPVRQRGFRRTSPPVRGAPEFPKLLGLCRTVCLPEPGSCCRHPVPHKSDRQDWWCGLS